MILIPNSCTKKAESAPHSSRESAFIYFKNCWKISLRSFVCSPGWVFITCCFLCTQQKWSTGGMIINKQSTLSGPRQSWQLCVCFQTELCGSNIMTNRDQQRSMKAGLCVATHLLLIATGSEEGSGNSKCLSCCWSLNLPTAVFNIWGTF